MKSYKTQWKTKNIGICRALWKDFGGIMTFTLRLKLSLCFFCFVKHRGQKLRFPGRDPGPGRYRDVREAYRIRFHLFLSRFDLVARSYDQTTKKVNDHQIHDYFNVSVFYKQNQNEAS